MVTSLRRVSMTPSLFLLPRQHHQNSRCPPEQPPGGERHHAVAYINNNHLILNRNSAKKLFIMKTVRDQLTVRERCCKIVPPKDRHIFGGTIFLSSACKRRDSWQKQSDATTSSLPAIQNEPWRGHRQGRSPALPGPRAENRSYGIARPLFQPV